MLLISYFLQEKWDQIFKCDFLNWDTSMITIFMNILLNAVYWLEYLKLSISRIEYRVLILCWIIHLYLFLHELVFVLAFLEKFKVNILHTWEKFKFLILLFLATIIIVSNSMLYNESFLILFWASLWIPQILHNIAYGWATQINNLLFSLPIAQLLNLFYISWL